jgi:hypothetical protein
MIYTKKMAHGIAFNGENTIASSSLRLLWGDKAISTSLFVIVVADCGWYGVGVALGPRCGALTSSVVVVVIGGCWR